MRKLEKGQFKTTTGVCLAGKRPQRRCMQELSGTRWRRQRNRRPAQTRREGGGAAPLPASLQLSQGLDLSLGISDLSLMAESPPGRLPGSTCAVPPSQPLAAQAMVA